MNIYDVTIPIANGMLVWPGDPGVSIETKTTVAKQGVKLSYLSFSSHTGTHIDAPSHFVKGGVNLDKVPLEKFIGECHVVDVTKTGSSEITPDDFSHVSLAKGGRLLFKTGNFRYLRGKKFPDTYVSLSLEAAKLLAKEKVHLVGTDFLGIEKRKNPGHPVHTTLLTAGIVIVEGLDLSKVPSGKYQLYCLPLHVVGVDGAPARVILMSS